MSIYDTIMDLYGCRLFSWVYLVIQLASTSSIPWWCSMRLAPIIHDIPAVPLGFFVVAQNVGRAARLSVGRSDLWKVC